MKKGSFYSVYTDYIGSLLGISGGFVRIYLSKLQHTNDFLEEIVLSKEYEAIILRHIKKAWDNSRLDTKQNHSLKEYRILQEQRKESEKVKYEIEDYYKNIS